MGIHYKQNHPRIGGPRLGREHPLQAIDWPLEKKVKKILLVDDSCTARLVNRMIFSQKSNYVLISAVDGKEAVERAKREKPDLILMDIVMPRMTGLEACRVLKRDKETEKIPVILLTTRGEEQYVQEGYASGCSDYLTKPVNDVELLDLLKAYLGE